MEERSLGAILLETSALTQEQLDHALTFQKEKGIRLGDALVQLKFLRQEDILRGISIQMGMEYLKYHRFRQIQLIPQQLPKAWKIAM